MSGYVLFVVYVTNEDVINETQQGPPEQKYNETDRHNNDNNEDNDCETDAVPETPDSDNHVRDVNVFLLHNATERQTTASNGNSGIASCEDVKTGTSSGESEVTTNNNPNNSGEQPNISVAQQEPDLKRFLSVHSLKQDVIDTLTQLNVKNAVWQKTYDNSLHQVTFIQESGKRCEQILEALTKVGVGRIAGSSLCVFPSSVNIVKEAETEKDEDYDLNRPSVDLEVLAEENKSEFQKSIKSRLVVCQVIESVQSNAQFTFDYLMLIILASLIAGMGLAENSSVVLVASMLISPLMGPILAGVFGSRINNTELRNLGLKSELIGLGICVVIGFLFGLVTGAVGLKGAIWGSTVAWPTSEMSTRGQLRSLWSGALIALPSGAGVALSVLGGNAGSLVGVAISASLLPPAVNAGMLWAYAILVGFVPPHVSDSITNSQNISQINNTLVNGIFTFPPVCPKLENNEYVPIYSCNMAVEAAILGSISLLLTVLNIFCIIVMGIIMLKIKAVVPSSATLQEEFFHRDMMIYRQSYATMKGKKSAEIGKMFCEEYKKLLKQQTDAKMKAENPTEDEESCCSCLRFRGSKQNKKSSQMPKNPDTSDKNEEEDILSSVRLLFCREALEELEQSYEVKEILRQLPTGKNPPPISTQLSPVFTEAETKFHRMISTENEGSQFPYHTISAFTSHVFFPAVHKYAPRTPQPKTTHRPQQRFIFPERYGVLQRTHQHIPKSANASLSTINERSVESDNAAQRKFIVKTVKEEEVQPRTVEELPLLP